MQTFGKKKMRTRELEVYKRTLKLTKEQREVLIGILLGDAHLESQNRGRTYRLKIEQSLAHQFYVEHLYQIFREWVRTPPRSRRRISVKGRVSEMWSFQTYSHDAFRFYGQQFYFQRIKRVPKIIGRLLTSRALAYWFMDDGSIKWRSSRETILNTQGYAAWGVKRLAQVLQEKFGLDVRLRHQKEGYQICIRGDSLDSFVKLIGPFLIPEMVYKIPKAGRTLLPKK